MNFQQNTDETGLPLNWEVRHSNSKNLPYYFNHIEKVSCWEPPAGTDTDKLKTYMAKHHSLPSIPQKIRCAHLLVKHKDSRRPSSWKEASISRTRDQALEILKGHQARIVGGEVALGELALTESDCSSARKRGDLGYFGRGDMQQEFEEAAFALKKPGDMSAIVETASGLHLIERLE